MRNDQVELETLVGAIQSGPTEDTRGGGHSAAKLIYDLVDGRIVMAKTDDGNPETTKKVHREVAAFKIAELMGCSHLLARTWAARVPDLGGNEVNAAVIAIWPDNEIQPPVPHDQLNDLDVWWTACFDAVILQTDRDGNWGTAPDGKTPRLFDHGNAFDMGGPGSHFYNMKIDQDIPAEIKAGLQNLLDDGESAGLKDLLPPGEYDSVVKRVQALLQSGKLRLQ
ncbi:MAG TPA: hypothetical protein VM784_03340 [Actinomycetota bacterium]|nr:hypothetical protein [Actinomycetota bacterium]